MKNATCSTYAEEFVQSMFPPRNDSRLSDAAIFFPMKSLITDYVTKTSSVSRVWLEMGYGVGLRAASDVMMTFGTGATTSVCNYRYEWKLWGEIKDGKVRREQTLWGCGGWVAGTVRVTKVVIFQEVWMESLTEQFTVTIKVTRLEKKVWGQKCGLKVRSPLFHPNSAASNTSWSYPNWRVVSPEMLRNQQCLHTNK